MLLPLAESLRPEKPLKDNMIGIVVDNVDPLGRDRIKVKVKGIYETANLADLPWVYPKGSSSSGGRPDVGSSSVPELYSQVTVSWPTKDLYYAQYDGAPVTALTSQALFQGNTVPEAPSDELPGDDVDPAQSNSSTVVGEAWSMVKDRFRTWFRLDKNQGTTEFFMGSSGLLFRADRAGNTQIIIPGNLDLQIKGELSVELRKLLRAVVKDLYVEVSGDKMQTVSGEYVLKTEGDIKTQSTGKWVRNGIIHDNSGQTVDASDVGTEAAKLSARISALEAKLATLESLQDNLVLSGAEQTVQNQQAAELMFGDEI